MAETPRPPEELHSDDAVASRDEGRVNVPADVIIGLADSVIQVQRESLAALTDENERLRRQLAQAIAFLRPVGTVLQ